MALNFYQGKDNIVKNLGRAQPDNSLLFSNDKFHLYGKFSNDFMLIGENRKLVCEDEYMQLSNNEKLKNRYTYYITDGIPEYEYPIDITLEEDEETLVILTNEVI